MGDSDDEFGRPLQPAAQDHRFGVGRRLPRRRSRGRRFGRGGAPVVAELLGQCGHQRRASWLSACGAGTDGIGTGCSCSGSCRTRGEDQHRDDRRDSDRDRGDQQGPRRAVAAASVVGATPATLGRAPSAIGQVRVRVMPLTCCTFGTTLSCRSSRLSRADAHHHVIRAGHVLGGQHAGQRGQLLGDDFGAAHLGLDQHESLDHPASPPFWLHRLHAAGTKRTAGRAVFRAAKQLGRRCHGERGADDSLAGLGEFAVIDRLVAAATSPRRSRSAPATTPRWSSPPTAGRVVSTDMLVEGRHFRLDWSSPHDVGRKAIAQNAADIEAMGAAATAFVVAFGAPGDTPAAQALELADGMWQEAAPAGRRHRRR